MTQQLDSAVFVDPFQWNTDSNLNMTSGITKKHKSKKKKKKTKADSCQYYPMKGQEEISTN